MNICTSNEYIHVLGWLYKDYIQLSFTQLVYAWCPFNYFFVCYANDVRHAFHFAAYISFNNTNILLYFKLMTWTHERA